MANFSTTTLAEAEISLRFVAAAFYCPFYVPFSYIM